MGAIIYADEKEDVLVELSHLFIYEVDIQMIDKKGTDFSSFEFRSRFFLGINDKITKTFSNYSITKEITLVAAPEGWLVSNNFHEV